MVDERRFSDFSDMVSDGVVTNVLQGRVQVAPMLGVTDRHFRRFFRGISRCAELWTEMQVDSALLHTDNLPHFLDFHLSERPLVCQLGGNNPQTMGQAAAVVARWGYDGINVNCGCPSNRVAGKGCFGAALMKDPENVAQIVSEIYRYVGTAIPISVKTRIGVDRDFDSYAHLKRFIDVVSRQGHCDRFIIHARKAWLSGVNPKLNRSIPPLKYHRVYQLTRDFPSLNFTLNGGVSSVEDIQQLLRCHWRPPMSASSHSAEQKNSRDLQSTVANGDPQLTSLVDGGCCGKVRSDQQELAPPSSASPTSTGACVTSSANESMRKTKQSKSNQTTTQSFADDAPDFTYDDIVTMMANLEALVKQDAALCVLQGVMVGRVAMNHPCLFSCVDSTFYNVYDPPTARTPRTILTHYLDYLDTLYPEPLTVTCPDRSVFPLVKPILGIFSGRPGSRFFRFHLDEAIRKESERLSPSDLITLVLDKVDAEFPGTLDTPTQAVCK